MHRKISTSLNTIILSLSGILFFCGGLGVKLYWVEIAGIIFGLISLILICFPKNKISFPTGITLYLIFIILLIINFFANKKFPSTYEYILLFSSGGLFWILFHNLKGRINNFFEYVILVLGLFFALLFLLNKFLKFNIINSEWNIYGTYTKVHNHIGDYWVIVILVLISQMQNKIRQWHLIILPLGLILITLSFSRSAYLSLFVGLAYLFVRKKEFGINKKFFRLGVLIIASMFILSGFTKTTFFSRPYFFQAFLTITKNPFGVGMGNFTLVSKMNPYILGIENTSVHAHNIFIEVLSGIGIFAITFFVWFYKVLSGIFKNKDEQSIIYQSIFLAISVNFLFDSTYYLPVMIWFWFTSLGLAGL